MVCFKCNSINRNVDKAKEMIETTHRCLRCNKTAYQIGEGAFKCSDSKCGFKWEITECGE